MDDLTTKQPVKTTVTIDNDIGVRLLQLLRNAGIDKLDERQQAILYHHALTNQNVSSVDADVYCKDRSLFLDSETRDEDIVDIRLIARSLVNVRTKSYKTLLHLSSEIGDLELVDIFLKAGAHVDARDIKNTTALYWSARNGFKEVVKILLKAGATVDAKSNYSDTSLHLSARNGHKDIVEILLKSGANVDARNNYNDTPLHLCARENHKEIVETLLKAGAIVDASNTNSNTPLHLSACHGHKEIVEILINAGAIVDTKNYYSNTPLHLSAWDGHKEVVEILLKAGANVDAKNYMDNTPLHLCAENGNKEMIETLLRAGAQVEKKYLNRYPVLNNIYTNRRFLSDDKFVATLTWIKNWMYSATNITRSVRSPASTTTTISYTETTSARFPTLEKQILSSETRASNKDADDIVKESLASSTSETTVDEIGVVCSDSVSSVASPSVSSYYPHDTELPCLDIIREQFQEHCSQFSPKLDEGWETTCSAEVKAAFQDGRVIMPTTINITNKKKIVNQIVNHIRHANVVNQHGQVSILARRESLADHDDDAGCDDSDTDDKL